MTVSDGALGESTYAQSLYIWNSNDEKILELLYGNTTGTNEVNVLIRFMPSRTNAGYSSTGIVECQVSGLDGSRSMVCSMSGGPFSVTSPSWSEAIVKAVELGDELKVTSISRSSDAVTTPQCPGGNQDYFPLAYIVKTAEPYYTTAMFGYNDDAISDTACTVTNTANKGLNK